MTDAGPVGIRDFAVSRSGESDECCEVFGFVVGRTPAGNLHAGAAYRDVDGELRFVHLAWEDAVQTGWEFDGLACEPLLESSILEYCAEIAFQAGRRYKDTPFPYDFGLGGAHFERDGSFRPGRSTVGLTCASFVAAIFEGGANVALVDEAGLPDRPNETAHWLNSFPRSAEHIKQRMQATAQAGAKRLKPAEALAAAGWPNPHPADGQWCVCHGECLESSI